MNIMYDEKLLGTVAFSNGCLCSKKLTQREHRHFHPSGDPSPSSEDIVITNNLKEAGNILGLNLLDHIIIADNNYFSFHRENML